MNRKIIFFLLLFSLLNSCKQKVNNAEGEKMTNQSEIKKTSYKLEQVWATDTLLKTPESVIYDKERNVLYVANVNENPWEKDKNGFISRVSVNGEILDLEWVAGFSGPKGMAIVDNRLYVADLDEIGVIDIEAGELQKKIKVEGASGLNDITPGANGKIFISDSNGGKLYQYENDEISLFHENTPGRPNGLLVDQGKLLVAFSQASEFVTFDLITLEKTSITDGIGGGGGITPTNEDKTYLVSDWNGEVFLIDLEGQKQSLLNTKDQKKNTADIWFIKDQNLVLVPTFFDNRVVAYKLVEES